MVAEQVQIGRRSVCLDDFKQAVASNVKVKDVCGCLGFNTTVATTKQAIKYRIEEYGLDTSHFKQNYTKSEAVLSRDRKKHFNLNQTNRKDYNVFEEYRNQIDESSWGTYKASIGNYMESLGDKDFATVTIDEMLVYVDGRKNSKNILAHLRSLMLFILKQDINDAVNRADRKTMVALMPELRQSQKESGDNYVAR